MAATSLMLELGTVVPPFFLPDPLTGASFSSDSLSGHIAVVAFLCNHCPYVKHLQRELAAFGTECAEKGVRMVAISSNDVQSHPEDGPAEMAREAKLAGYAFPYLYDEPQGVAKAFRAVCTPEFYLFDASGKLAYRGRFDESTPRNGRPVTGKDLRTAVDALVRGAPVTGEQSPSIGCSIKWKRGNAPDYG
jgi:hypothetical protein